MHSSTRMRRWLGTLLGGAMLALAGTSLAGSEFDNLRNSAVTPGSKAAELKYCVAPKEEIRRNHMEYLKHDRDLVVHDGNRSVRYSLAQCVDCHAAKDAAGAHVPINAEKQFCAQCHDYTAVNMNCFQCHRKTPEGK